MSSSSAVPKQALVLAGGRGTRLAPFTAVIPKPLLPVGDRPILDTVLRQLKGYGFERIILAVSYLQEIFEAVIGSGERYGLAISYLRESEPLGTAGALSLVEPFGEHLLVMNGDVLTTLDFDKFLRFHEQRQAAFSVALSRRRVDIDYGIIRVNAEYHVVDYLEKPSLDYLVSTGVYAVAARALSYLERGRAIDMPDLVGRLLAADELVQAYPYDGYWLDIGRQSDYDQACREFSAREAELIPPGPAAGG